MPLVAQLNASSEMKLTHNPSNDKISVNNISTSSVLDQESPSCIKVESESDQIPTRFEYPNENSLKLQNSKNRPSSINKDLSLFTNDGGISPILSEISKKSEHMNQSSPFCFQSNNIVIEKSLINDKHVTEDDKTVLFPDIGCFDSKIENNKIDITPESFNIPKEILDISSPIISAPIFPANTSNIAPNPIIPKCSNFAYHEGSFTIKNKIFSIIYQNNKLNSKYYPYCLRKEIFKHINNVCTIVFKYVKYLKKKPEVHIIGQCKQNNNKCKKFKVIFNINTLLVNIFSSSKDYSHPSLYTGQVKKEALLKANKVVLKKGKNLQDIKSDPTLRRIRSEAMSNLDRHKNDLVDLVMMQGEHPEYIKEISMPFNVKLYSIEQLKVLKNESKNHSVTVYFDATGSVMVSKDVDLLSTHVNQNQYSKDLIAKAIQINDITSFDIYMQNACIILTSKYRNEHVLRAIQYFGQDFTLQYQDYKHLIPVLDIPLESSKDGGIFKGSMFYKRYKNISNTFSQIVSTEGSHNNIYFNIKIYNTLLNKYIPLCPLWSAVMHKQNIIRLSNAPIENYFGDLKLNTLNCERNLKCSKFIRILRRDVLAFKVESDLEIPKSGLNRWHGNTESDERYSQETWNKTKRKISSHFDGRYLKKCDILTEDTDEKGNNKIPVNLETESPSEISIEPKKLFIKCTEFLTALNLSEKQKLEIESKTRQQSLCDLWKHERKIRITASFVGRICKARNDGSYKNIIKSIFDGKGINTPATTYGMTNESTARDLYAEMKNINVTPAGLFIHREHPFIAASPDGLVGSDGIIEIKCPYKAKDCDAETFDFDFLDKNNQFINKHHNYYYQVQTILEATNRYWCDLVVYTQKNIKIIKIERSLEFWSSIEKQLVNFYMFHMLPEIISPNNSMSLEQKKWTTTKKLSFLENGLVNDFTYYKYLKNKRLYAVTAVEQLNTMVKELYIDDFLSLDEKMELTSFVLDHSLFLINQSDKYQILSVEHCSLIFGNNKMSKDWMTNNIHFNNNFVVMPFEYGRHYMLMLLDFEQNICLFIDPMGKEQKIQDRYFQKLENIFLAKNININMWQIITKPHIIQTDYFNCGVYVIYFFHQIVNNLMLTMDVDINQYTEELKNLLLNNSDDMKKRCLFCARSTDSSQCFKCTFCHRSIHEKCLLSYDEIQQNISKDTKTQNDMCDLCRLN
ncbi:unnamed protein product [Ceutorhynchus assimilis]|uniref:Ubiquitin-like protease family profile domain-containing protein n=1 Tax=Ceutorhynchus assimilis TaxID=467358 RepID=A0A9N9N1J7_9CUCU|nr:unnamed protein product [Ceutorhynchus assimilis]